MNVLTIEGASDGDRLEMHETPNGYSIYITSFDGDAAIDIAKEDGDKIWQAFQDAHK